MDWLEKLENMILTDNLSENLIDFLINKEYINGNCESKKWKNLFEKIENWKNRYCVKSDITTLYGINCWYIDLFFGEFVYQNNDKYSIEEYLIIIMLISYKSVFNTDYKFYIQQNFTEELKKQFQYEKKSFVKLSKKSLIDELNDRYIHSYNRFQLYKKGNNNPEVVIMLEEQYPQHLEYINYFKNNLDDCNIVRINEFGYYEDVWYFVKNKDTIYVTLIQDII